MQRAKKNELLAMGPAFDSRSQKTTSRRVMLVKNRDENGDTNEYVVITKKQPRNGLTSTSVIRDRVATTDFTHAVRMFCDHILEQAWRDDLRYEGEA
ncbi:MAG TPA: hypothetical protein VGZ22_22360 [Isosphaeraceae bacterium]|jgi:hypothetical protein|nr:hypothetical protein [Isosphaeraceae bacterium]